MATSDNLQRDRLFATLGMLSGDRALAPAGKAELEEITRREAIRLSRKASMGHGFILDSASGEVVRDPAYSDYETQHDADEAEQRAQLQKDMLERLGAAANYRATQPHYVSTPTEGGVVPTQINPNAPGGARTSPTLPVTPSLTAEDRQKAAEFENLANNLRSFRSGLERDESAISSPKDIALSAVSHVPLIGTGAKQALTGKLYTADQQTLRAYAQTLRNQYLKTMSGAAVTPQEQQRLDDAFPFAEGITTATALARLPAFIGLMDSKAKALRGANTPPSGPPPAPTNLSAPIATATPNAAPNSGGGKLVKNPDGTLSYTR